MKKLLIFLAIALSAAVFTHCKHNDNINSTMTGIYPDAGKYKSGNFTYSASDVNEVSLDWLSGSVKIVKNNEGTLNVYETDTGLTDEQKLHWYLDEDTLKIKFCKSGYVGIFPPDTKALTVEIPDGIKLDIQTVSAPVTLGSHTLAKAELSSTSGNFEIESISAEKLDINTTSGDIKITNAALDTTAKASTTSGKIELDAATAEELKLSSVSGAITVNNADIKTDVKFSSTSGELELVGVSCERLKLSTVSGDIDVGISKCKEAELDTTSGNCSIALPESGAVIDFSTTSGDFTCGKASEIADDKYIIGNGECGITFDSISGSLTVD